MRGAAGACVFRCAGHLAKVVDRGGDAIVAMIVVESRQCGHVAAPPQKRPATGRGGSNPQCLESAKVLFLGVNLGNVGSPHDFCPGVVSECQAVRSSKAGFADVNDVLAEIDHRMVVAVGTLDRADADVIVRDMVWPACCTRPRQDPLTCRELVRKRKAASKAPTPPHRPSSKRSASLLCSSSPFSFVGERSLGLVCKRRWIVSAAPGIGGRCGQGLQAGSKCVRCPLAARSAFEPCPHPEALRLPRPDNQGTSSPPFVPGV